MFLLDGIGNECEIFPGKILDFIPVNGGGGGGGGGGGEGKGRL